jgi:predicted RND superfamily exporter protein
MGIAISLFLSLFILPSLLPENLQSTREQINPTYSLSCYKSRKNAFKVFSLWIFFILLSFSMFFLVTFETDVRRLDGINSQLKADEENFKKIWGKNTMAAATTSSTDLSTAMRKIDILTINSLEEKIDNIQSLSQIWPSISSRKTNGSHWIEFWKSGNENKLKHLLISEGERFSFTEDAFAPFFSNLYKISYPDDKNFLSGSFNTIASRFIIYKHKQWHVSMFFPDTVENITTMKQLAAPIGGIDIISPGSFGSYISEIIIKDALKIGIISIILTILLALICLKNILKLCAAFLPVISGLAAIFPVFLIFNTPLNTVSCVASIIVTGLAIDYGIFSVSACTSKDPIFSKDAFSALSFSLISTFIGASALLFADHPALFSVGLVVSTGVLVAYLTAVFVTPALISYFTKK